MDEIIVQEQEILDCEDDLEKIDCDEEFDEEVFNEDQDKVQIELDDEPLVGVQKGRFDHIKFNRKVGVYIKVNDLGYIIDVGSDVFIKDLEGWQKIDEGEGDKYVFAQTQYFGTLVDEKGNYKFKKQ